MRNRLALILVALVALGACRAKEVKQDVVPALLADLQGPDSEKSGRANLELIRIGEPAVPGLVELLKSDDPRLRKLAASAFWGMGAKARSAVPALAEALADKDAGLRTSVAMALQNMGPDAEAAVPALIKALSDPDRGVRQVAVKALGEIGPAAKPAIPVLTRALKKGSWPEAQEAILRIRGVAPGTPINLDEP